MKQSSSLFLIIAICLSVLSTSAQSPITVLDRIGADSVATDNNPGGIIVHYAHGTSTELWGTCGTAWTQPFDGTLAEGRFVLFARVVSDTNGMVFKPVTNLSGFSMSFHLWTNGASGFLNSTNPAHGDVVIPLGPGPAAPELFGITSITNQPANSTNRYISVLPTLRYATNLAACNIALARGREYVMALVFEGGGTNVVIRQSTVAPAGPPDVFATYNATTGLRAGPSTNAPATPNFATAVSVLGAANRAPVAAADTIQRYASGGVNVHSSALLANDTDADGDPLSLTSVSPSSAHGASILLQSSWVKYVPLLSYNDTDTFTYTASDGRGGTDTGTVTVNISTDTAPALDYVALERLSGGAYRVTFNGGPRRAYSVEYAENLSAPVTWHTLGTATADASGLLSIEDPSGSLQRYYRAIYR